VARRRPQELEPVLATIGGSPSIIERHRLTPLLEGLDGVRLVLVRAPAGYGKTTFLRAAWRRLRLAESRASWVSLSVDDDEPGRIERILVEALERALDSAPRGRAVVFLDGAEELRGAATEEALRRRIAALPEDATIVLGTRHLPEIGIGELRLRGELREIGRDDLRFDLVETALLFRVARRSLPEGV
jgi:LuxR family transcriptional regulator, maltose regulon positive regulatory protein